MTRLRTFDTPEAGVHTFRQRGGTVWTSQTVLVGPVPTASATAALDVVAGPLPRTIVFNDQTMTYGDELLLSSSTDGDGTATYRYIAGPGSVSAAGVVSASNVGKLRVRVDYPDTGKYAAGSALADVSVVPRPISFTLEDQDFDYDGGPKVAKFSVSDPGALLAGMVDTSGLIKGPEVNTYSVVVTANGNYIGSASARMRIFPTITSFTSTLPPTPEVVSLRAPSSVQWPSRASIDWSTKNAGTVSLVDENGSILSNSATGTITAALLNARDAAYGFSVVAEPLPGSIEMSQRGATSARLTGPGGDVDVTGLSSLPVSASGAYHYTVSSNGLSRTADLNYTAPAAATRASSVAVTPATVNGVWSDRTLDGPYLVRDADVPEWTLQTGDRVVAPARITALRRDEGRPATADPGGTLLPGVYHMTAQFVPPNANYRAASVSSTWSLTAPITINAVHASMTINGVPQSGSVVLRLLPGAQLTVSAKPERHYDWGADWDLTAARVWSGSPELIPDPTRSDYSVHVPSGRADLSLTAAAYQLGPKVVEFTPVAASYTVSGGLAGGQTYLRSWMNDGAWNAYLGREGVTFKVAGVSRESGIDALEIQAKAPSHDWETLTAGSPPSDVPNGPRVLVPQTFSVKLGSNRDDKPLMPADPSLAGKWLIRARVRSTAGVWSDWGFEQALNVQMPLQAVSKRGRTLPPVADAAWYSASEMKDYVFKVWIP